ncbi:MAG: ABC transporter ATP-binding protein [Deltaproteobacteria bacterium]|nr:MAG: ABC transporter ATP-binding protein [Deltaproteobacteria bacterium]TMA69739.1 MAG: ABC transporter ATP-binding protein [Deltaproteobacteria bacterium]
MHGEPALEVRDLRKTFGRVEAVAGVSFRVGAGEIVGFLGPNGAGKTTTMRILAGIFPPTAGEVRVAGHDVIRQPLACRRAVGYFPEYAPFYPDLGVQAYLTFVARLKRIARPAHQEAVGRALAACGLEAVARRRIGTLSKGYRQRVGLAQALLGDPPILVLDEPTIGLDPAQVVEMRALLAGLRGERTVFFSSHVIAEVAALCERVIVIARGRLVAEGAPDELGDRLRGRRRVVLKVDGPAAEVAAALGAAPGVLAVERAADGFVVEGASEAELARAAGEAVKQRGWTVLELRHEAPGLEEIFLGLVGNGGRSS